MYPVSVDQAIGRGRKSIHLPMLLIFLAVPVLVYMVLPKPYGLLCSPVLFLISFALAGWYWSYAVPRWMIWAFTNVRNVYELKRRATYALLITDEPNLGLRRFERWTESQKRAWMQLELRFNQADEFVDDPTVPAETRVYFSLTRRLLVLPLYLFMAIGGGYLLFSHQKDPYGFKAIWGYFFQAMFSVAGIWLSFNTIRQMLNRSPQIVMNDEGLQTAHSSFYSWSVVNNISIVVQGTGKYRTYYLKYYIKGVKISLELDIFTMSRSRIDQYLHVYRGRFMNKPNKFNAVKNDAFL